MKEIKPNCDTEDKKDSSRTETLKTGPSKEPKKTNNESTGGFLVDRKKAGLILKYYCLVLWFLFIGLPFLIIVGFQVLNMFGYGDEWLKEKINTICMTLDKVYCFFEMVFKG